MALGKRSAQFGSSTAHMSQFFSLENNFYDAFSALTNEGAGDSLGGDPLAIRWRIIAH